jgi:coenzyme F420 hydrogenase subunit beta
MTSADTARQTATITSTPGTAIDQVIAGGYCIGCGACSFADPARFAMRFGDDGAWRAARLPNAAPDEGMADRLCPFTGNGPDETGIAAGLWPHLPAQAEIGRYLSTIVGHVTDEALRLSGGSGGLITWLSGELLRRGDVDAVVHVQPAPTEAGVLFHYAISRSEAEIRRGSKSRYYPVTLAEMFRDVATSSERVAFVAIPCFAKAIRLLIAAGQLDRDRVPFVIGLVCGHMKSSYFADYLAWQRDAAPGSLTGFDFRHKLMDRPASSYGFRMITQTRNEVHPMASVRGHDWGEGLFKLPACEFCDDVMAECADVAIGDAWLPDFVADPKGTNIAVIRDARIASIIEEGRHRNALWLTDISPETVAQSQASGLRHRREGLAHRRARAGETGTWTPPKRVAAAMAPTKQRRQIYDLRLAITLKSNQAFARARAANDINLFEREMAPLLGALRRVTHGSQLQRTLRKLRGLPRRIARKALKTIRQLAGQSG